jgi:hypothetical protein
MIEAFPASSDGYASLLSDLKERIRTARLRAAVSVNEEPCVPAPSFFMLS